MRGIKPEAILERLRLAMPVSISIEDPQGQPIVIAYENLHSLLILDIENLELETQVIVSMYGEMGRFERACQFEAVRAEARYRSWRSVVQQQFRADRTKGCAKDSPKPKQPSVKELEDCYRTHEEYVAKCSEGERFKAIAGFFGDLKWAFKMKSEMILAQSRIVSGYETVARNEEAAIATLGSANRLTAYENIAAEAAEIAAASGSSAGLADLLSSTPIDDAKLSKTPRALG